ncbi:unnamed protein product [Prorocentrum cordatum]|uniref:EF-hand domain-containing protein n=1 Tax=Prorocentrum cordatum TaxID=2364126 RepID=A0ABN9RFU9_9DINO|nr:unnamed protein product [Polarella glacialis]
MLTQWGREPRRYDADKSGVLDKMELRQMLRALWGRHQIKKELSPDVLDRIIQDLDHNGDGQIIRQEFVDLYEQVWDIIASEFGASSSSAPAASAGLAGSGSMEIPSEWAHGRGKLPDPAPSEWSLAASDGHGKGSAGDKDSDVFVICLGFRLSKADARSMLLRALPPDGGDELGARGLALRISAHRMLLGAREAVSDLTETQWDFFPVSGPGTVTWVCGFIRENGVTFRSRHVKLKAETRLASSDQDASVYELCCRSMHLVLTYRRSRGRQQLTVELWPCGAASALNFLRGRVGGGSFGELSAGQLAGAGSPRDCASPFGAPSICPAPAYLELRGCAPGRDQSPAKAVAFTGGSPAVLSDPGVREPVQMFSESVHDLRQNWERHPSRPRGGRHSGASSNFDARSKVSPRLCAKCVRDLFKAGMVYFTAERKRALAPFFAPERDGSGRGRAAGARQGGDQPVAAARVDGVAIIGSKSDEVVAQLESLHGAFNNAGLKCKNVEIPSREQKFARLVFDRERGCISLGLGSGSPRVRSWRVVGHFRWAALLRRPLLRIFQSTYRFIEKVGDSRWRLRPELAREPRVAAAFAPFAHCGAKRPVDGAVYPADASAGDRDPRGGLFGGDGATKRRVDEGLALDAARVRERWRRGVKGAIDARDFALATPRATRAPRGSRGPASWRAPLVSQRREVERRVRLPPVAVTRGARYGAQLRHSAASRAAAVERMGLKELRARLRHAGAQSAAGHSRRARYLAGLEKVDERVAAWSEVVESRIGRIFGEQVAPPMPSFLGKSDPKFMQLCVGSPFGIRFRVPDGVIVLLLGFSDDKNIKGLPRGDLFEGGVARGRRACCIRDDVQRRHWDEQQGRPVVPGGIREFAKNECECVDLKISERQQDIGQQAKKYL